MTKLLISSKNQEGYCLEDVLRVIRTDILERCLPMSEDSRQEAQHVVANNMRILTLISEAIEIAEESTEVLSRVYGGTQAAKGKPPKG